MNENDFQKIDGMIARHIGVFADSIQHKLDLVVEGHQMLADKIDQVKADLSQRIDCVEHKLDIVAAKTDANTEAILIVAAKTDANTEAIQTVAAKLDAVAADLKAHRADTEVHEKVYKVKES